MKRIDKMLLLAFLVAASCSSGSAEPQGRSRQLLVLVDRSASQSDVTRSEHLAYLRTLITRLDYGDEAILLRVNQKGPREEDYQPFIVEIPAERKLGRESSLDRDKKSGVIEGALSALEVLYADSIPARNTDLFSTFHVASELVQDAGNKERVIVVLSDMLQSAQGVEMDRLRRMPSPTWLRDQQHAGTLPSLQGACVMVVGADDSEHGGVVVRDFWIAYFGAAGATLTADSYRLRPPITPRDRCQSLEDSRG
ncbi:MAG: hypothetical protein ACRERX_11410 [Pseudomonas sp.]